MAASEPTASVVSVGPLSNRAVAWIAGLVPVALAVVGLLILVSTRDAPYPADSWGFRGFSAIFALTCGTVGAILLAHRPGNRIAWLVIAVAVLAGVQLLAEEYLAIGVIAAPGSLPAVEWVAWAMNWLWIPQFVVVVVFLLVFPDSRLVSPRWQAVVWLALMAGTVGILVAAFMPGPLTDFKLVLNPLGFGSSDRYAPATLAYRVGLMLALGLAAWSMVVRYRRAGPVERLQLRWVAFAAAVAALTAPLGFIDNDWSQAIFILALCGLPVAAGVAILRYHLYDIDLIINRTLVYVSLTAILAGVYTASVVLMQRLFVAVTGEVSDAVFVLTTLVVVIVFTPIKNGLQSIVDRRFKEIGDPTAPLAAFVDRVRDGVWRLDPMLVVRRLLEVAVDSLAASGGTAELDGRPVSRVGLGDQAPALTSTAGAGTARISLVVGPRLAGVPYEDRDRAALDAAVDAVAGVLADQGR
jgi:hypothetical protein